MWLVAAFLYRVCHLRLRHSFQKSLWAAHVTPHSDRLLNGEHPALHGIIWLTQVVGRPHFREVSLKVLLSILLPVS